VSKYVIGKYAIGTIVMINEKKWTIAEYRMGRGRRWMYTLAYETIDGRYDIMRLEEQAIDSILDESK